MGLGHKGISNNKFLSHSTSLLAEVKAINLEVEAESEIQVCFLEAHEITPPPKRNTHPLVSNLHPKNLL